MSDNDAPTPEAETPAATVDLSVALPGQRVIELVLEIVLEAMKGQTADQRKQMWDFYISDVARWRKFWGVE